MFIAYWDDGLGLADPKPLAIEDNHSEVVSTAMHRLTVICGADPQTMRMSQFIIKENPELTADDQERLTKIFERATQ